MKKEIGRWPEAGRPAPGAPPEAAGRGRGAGQRAGRRAVHVGLGGHAEGRRAEPPQSAGEPAPARRGGRHHAARHRPERAAGVPQLRADRRPAAAAAVGRAHVPLPVAAALPHGPRAGLRAERDDPLRDRHVPRRLRPRRRQLRLLRLPLRVRRRRAGQGRDPQDLVRQVRHPHPRGLRRDGNGAGALPSTRRCTSAPAPSAGCCRASSTVSTRCPGSPTAPGSSSAART